MLHGPEDEKARLAAMLKAAHEGRASSVLIHGEAGAGKSALLEDIAAHARGARVLRTVGLQSETAFAFAALGLRRPRRRPRPVSSGAASGRRAARGTVKDRTQSTRLTLPR